MSKDKPATQTFADYEVITPVNQLRKAVSSVPLAPGDDPVARAERALQDLSGEFAGWMQTECERLDQARHEVKRQGFNTVTKEALFHAAHDIKGEADTFGYPGVTGVAESLCRLIEHAPDITRIPLQLIDQHVDAVRAIHREYARSDATELAFSLSRRLREVTDEFLIHVNRHRPEVLELIQGPPLAPG
jgi:HPt (histidine-containing phosphotransfer) domain-containing protein